MKKIGIAILLAAQILLFGSCLTTKQTNLLREPGGSIPHYPLVDAIGEYRIKPGDELQISITATVFDQRTEQLFSLFSSKYGNLQGEGDMKLRSFAVKPDGGIYFPYIGDIFVSGKTTLEIQEILKQKLNEKITEDCLVNVYLNNRFFSVIGETNVGRYPIAKEQMTIFQALSQCQDIFPYGDRSKVKVIRQTEFGSTVKTFDVRSSDIINSEFYYIQPNDVIYIQPLGRQFWGINSFGAVFAVLSTIVSVGLIFGTAKNW